MLLKRRPPSGLNSAIHRANFLIGLRSWIPLALGLLMGLGLIAEAQSFQVPSAAEPLADATLKPDALPLPAEDSVSDVPVVSDKVQPFEPEGTLVLIGGGGVPSEIRRLIAEAGQAGKPGSCLVIMPTSSMYADKEPAEYWTEPWTRFGFESIEILHTRDRLQADTDEFTVPLTRATAVWVPGGDQNRFTEVYAQTRTETRLKELLARGGVVSGTSAGAAMASRVMIAGGAKQPQMGRGLDLLPGAIVDQHFANRGRMPRLKQAVSQHPECVGIGIDEATAAVFSGRSMRIIGKGSAYVVLPATNSAPELARKLDPGEPQLDWTMFLIQAHERRQPAPKK